MKKLFIVTGVVFLLAPLAVSAEEVSASGAASAGTAVATDGTTASADANVSAEGTVTAPPIRRESPTLPSKGVVAPRDAASGLPTGKRQHEPIMLRESPTRASTGKTMMTGATTSENAKTMVAPHVLEKRETMMEKRASSSAAREERREEAREQLLEKRFEIMKRFIAQQVHRMEAMIERLTKIADRLASRIQKLKERGVDTVKTEELLAIARTKLNDARTALAAAKTEAEVAASARVAVGDVDGDGKSDIAIEEEGVQAQKPADAGKGVRTALQKARDAVRAAHRALVDAIASLNAGVKTTSKATTTANTQ